MEIYQNCKMKTWVDKHQPKTSKDIEGHPTAIEKLKRAIKGNKVALLHGRSGVGKTSAVHALAKELNLEILELNASDLRNAENIDSIIKNALSQTSLFGLNKLILVDEIDGLNKDDRGGAAALGKLLSNNKFPLVMTANDPWDSKLSTIRSKSELIDFSTPSYITVYNVLKKICAAESIKFEEEALKTIARRSEGDIRGAINDLQSLALNKSLSKADVENLDDREKKETIFNAIKVIFKSKNAADVLGIFEKTSLDLDECMLWIDENLPREYFGNDLVEAYDKLSKADVFKGRISNRQHWRFLVYRSNLMSAGVAVSKEEKNNAFISYKRTGRILKLWQAKNKYNKRKEIAKKLAKELHISSHRLIKDVMPYIQILYKKGIDLGFKLEEEELDWLKQ